MPTWHPQPKEMPMAPARPYWKNYLTARAPDDTAPILVPYGAGIWTFGDHLRHLAAHAGHIPLALDEFGRCVICIRRGFFTPNA